MIVYAEADETVVPKYDILHLGKDDPTHSETHRYPFAGMYINCFSCVLRGLICAKFGECVCLCDVMSASVTL